MVIKQRTSVLAQCVYRISGSVDAYVLKRRELATPSKNLPGDYYPPGSPSNLAQQPRQYLLMVYFVHFQGHNFSAEVPWMHGCQRAV
jgi:hypothetical protein